MLSTTTHLCMGSINDPIPNYNELLSLRNEQLKKENAKLRQDLGVAANNILTLEERLKQMSISLMQTNDSLLKTHALLKQEQMQLEQAIKEKSKSSIGTTILQAAGQEVVDLTTRAITRYALNTAVNTATKFLYEYSAKGIMRAIPLPS